MDELTHTPLHSAHANEQLRPAFLQEHLIDVQPVLHEHLIISNKDFGATSLSVIIGMKLDPTILQPQSVGFKSIPLHACTWW